jgi:Stage II sporulation protein E (SpoIIE)/ANTAR domain
VAGREGGDQVSDGGDDLARLGLVIERQRRELAALRAAADVTSVVAMARGMLMERSGCAAGEAAAQLADMAVAAGLPLHEMAAAVLHRVPVTGDSAAPAARAAGQPGHEAPSASWPLRELMALVAADCAEEGSEIVGALADQVLGPLGASAIAVWLLGPDGSLELLGERGLGGMTAARWRFLPRQFDTLAQRSVRDDISLWWAAGIPPGDAIALAGRWGDDAARAVLPLRRHSGALFGVLAVWWPGPLPGFTDETRLRLSALAAGFAEILSARLAHGGLLPWDETAVLGLLDEIAGSVLLLHPLHDGTGRLTDFAISHLSVGYVDPAGRDPAELAGLSFLEAYPGSTSSGLFTQAARVLESGQPEHVPGPVGPSLAGLGQDVVPVADLRAVPFFAGVVFTWREISGAGQAAELLEHAQRLGQLGGWEENLATGTAVWTDSAFAVFGLDPRRASPIPTAELHNFVIAADRVQVRRFRAEMLRRREPATVVFRVIRPGDVAIRQIKIFAQPVMAGTTVVALRGAFQDVSAHYHTQVALAATQDQLVDTEQRAAQEHQFAVRLQQAIMPPDQEPAVAMGVELAVRYRPVEPGHLVGGDWYDTVLLPSKELLLVVGDITGHGIDAVTGMVAARNALRGLAATGDGPARLLEHLNYAACHYAEGIAGTVICALYDPDSRVLRWARAGHLPPVLIREGAAGPLPLPGGVLLGLDPDARYEESTSQLRTGDMLLLFTDGLVERRDASITDALADFVALATPVAADAHGQADRMLATGLSDTGDDACLVAMRVL